MTVADTRDWVITKLSGIDGVQAIAALGEIFIQITRDEHSALISAIISHEIVSRDEVENVVSLDQHVDFVANIPKGAVWLGSGIEAARENNFGWGGFGDLMSVIGDEDVNSYQKDEYNFVLRSLEQHTRVSRVERVYDRVFRVYRSKLGLELDRLDVVLINEYELTAEHIRDTKAKYREFDLIVKTNPNGQITDQALEAAKQIGTRVLTWRQLMGRLNSR